MIPRHLQIGVGVLLAGVLAISVYMWHMRGRITRPVPVASDARPVAPPSSGVSEPVTLFVAYDNPGVLRAQAATISLPGGRQQRAEELLRRLLNVYLDKDSPHPLPPGSEIRSVYLIEPGTAVIDTNAALADGHRSGILVEELTIASMVQSLAVNVGGINRVKILVDGKQRDTLAGHADLSDFLDVSAVNGMVEQLAGL
jgi:hypothetical protein